LWAYPRNIVSLSYGLHAELAKEHGGEERWGYRRLHCGQISAQGRHLDELGGANEDTTTAESVSLQKRSKEAMGTLRAAGIPKDLDWFSPDSVRSYDEMGNPDTTAQVHPYQFTTSMAQLAEERGAEVVLGSATKINHSDDRVSSVTYTEKGTAQSKTIPATDVIISAGPWTRYVWPTAPISALRAHSVTVRPSRPVSAYALFTDISLPPKFGATKDSARKKTSRSTRVTPEIYARPNNEIYACGEGDTVVPLPATTADVETDDSRCQDIIDYISSISDELKDGEVTVRQACYLPNVESMMGGPIIGSMRIKGLFMAAGHTCWGIQNGPGTGKLISEFVFDGKAKSANVGNLDPKHFF
jgi:glycine/D-amino acid oxidase-like deaminating enzyme